MPYSLRKVPKKDLYWVIGPNGKHHSREGMTKEKARAQKRILDAAAQKELSGGVTGDTLVEGVPLKTWYGIVKAAYQGYSGTPPKTVGDFSLLSHTNELAFYYNPKTTTAIVGIRGTKDNRDWSANATLPLGTLNTTDRFKSDEKELLRMRDHYQQDNGKQVKWYGAAHSLGGAILDNFIGDGLRDAADPYSRV